MKKTQLQWVKERIKETGEISRNECLANYISRLGAIIARLKEQGYEFDAGFRKTERGEDYVYRATATPKRTVVVTDIVEREGVRVAVPRTELQEARV